MSLNLLCTCTLASLPRPFSSSCSLLSELRTKWSDCAEGKVSTLPLSLFGFGLNKSARSRGLGWEGWRGIWRWRAEVWGLWKHFVIKPIAIPHASICSFVPKPLEGISTLVPTIPWSDKVQNCHLALLEPPSSCLICQLGTSELHKVPTVQDYRIATIATILVVAHAGSPWAHSNTCIMMDRLGFRASHLLC